MVPCGAVAKLRELYDRYPMTVVWVTGFVLGIPVVCFIMLVVHELFGIGIYQKMYAPTILLLAEVFLYFLRKAAARHIKTDHENWGTAKSRFYSKYYTFLSCLLWFNAFAIIYSLLKG